MREKIAVLGGSFNPIHNGHIMLGIAAHEQYDIDRILVMPNKDAYYKDDDVFVSEKARTDMVKLAIEPYDYMEFSDIELKREGSTYTIDTIEYLRKQYPQAEIFFIIGGDSMKNLSKWYRIHDLMKYTHFLAARRSNIDYNQILALISEYKNIFPDCRIDILETENVDISSSEIRKLIKMREDVMRILPYTVFHYIKSHALYL